MKDQLHATFAATIPVVLVLTNAPAEREHEAERLAELTALLDTAGRAVLAIIIQHVQKAHPGTYVGSGKVQEIVTALEQHQASEVVFDTQLTPRQQRNLEEELESQVLDYDELILEIFSRNARTHQARLAVDLAHLEYTKSRLRRMWTHLDRQGGGGGGAGGSGARTGEGEKQIELDRRQVKRRIQDLKDRLALIESRTDRTVAARRDCFTVALVGYTNSGKSTLMNALTGAGVLAEDRLFATLDTRTSRLVLDGHEDVTLSDTVGFIRNLPHTLIASFHATLAEVREADLLLHVVDSSSPQMDQQIVTVEGVLDQIKAAEVPAIMVFNKSDRSYSRTLVAAFRKRYKHAVSVSALTGEGLDRLREAIVEAIGRKRRPVVIRYHAGDGALDAFVRSHTRIIAESYEDDQAVMTVEVDDQLLGELKAKPAITIVE